MAKALVYKATSDDTKDPSGFVLKELAQLSYVSPRESSTILEQLLKRLDKDKPDVKYKALRTIKYMCIHGRAEFRQELQRDHGLIKNAMHYKGPSDPMRGDTPNQRVRDEAKECSNAIFNTTGNARPSHATGRLEGFGSNQSTSNNHQYEATPSSLSSNPATSTYSHGTYSSPQHEYGGSVPKLESGAYSTGKMVGFGSSENTHSNSSSSILSKMKNKLTGGNDDVQRPTFKPYDRTQTYESPQPAYEAGAARRAAGAPGGVWGSAPAEQLHGNGRAQSTSNHYGTVAAPPTHGTNTTASRITSSTGEYESRLVDTITAATGVRPTPLKEELVKFTQQCESLDKFMIAGLLDAKLGSNIWQQQLKSLCVLESLLLTGSEEVEDYLCEHSGYLDELEHATNAQIKAKARRVSQHYRINNNNTTTGI